MLIQRADSDGSGTLPPPGIHAPLWDELVKQWSTIPAPLQSSVELGPETILVGRDDRETDDYVADENTDMKLHNFGWDNENPRRQVEVGRFRVDFRPITIKAFYEFWVDGTDEKISNSVPSNWVEDRGEIKVCMVRASLHLAKGMMGWFVGPHGLRPGTDEDRGELADDWIVRRVVGIR